MNDYFYIDASGQQKGPIPPSQFSMFNVSADTLVWCKGMADWQRAGAVDELKAYLDNDANGATPPPTPGTAGTAVAHPTTMRTTAWAAAPPTSQCLARQAIWCGPSCQPYCAACPPVL